MHCQFMRRVALFAALVLVVPVLAAPMAALAQGKAKARRKRKRKTERNSIPSPSICSW
jgi:hypothetical protein